MQIGVSVDNGDQPNSGRHISDFKHEVIND